MSSFPRGGGLEGEASRRFIDAWHRGESGDIFLCDVI